MNHCSITLRRLWAFMIAGLCIQTAGAADWKPVDPALLANAVPVVEKDADVEGIFWEVWVESAKNLNSINTELRHYVRLKIYTERGKEYASGVSITYPENVRIKDIEGRTIKPDGTIIKLDGNAIHERTLVSVRGFDVKCKSFALPAVEPGVLIEYQWKEIQPFSTYARYYLQRDIPLQNVTYHIKPIDPHWISYSNFSPRMNMITFNIPNVQQVKDPEGFYRIQFANVPAFREEPQMPPADSIRAFALVFYPRISARDSSQYWDYYGKLRYDLNAKRLMPESEVKEKTQDIIGKVTDPDEMIGKIFQFVRSSIKNIQDDSSDLTADQRKKFKFNEQPADTLSQRAGTSGDIFELFASMAIAAGLETRIALTGDRSDFFFNPGLADDSFLRHTTVAVKVGSTWKFYDPSSRYLPIGMLSWVVEGNSALIPDPNEPVFASIPLSPPERSRESRKAALKLSEDGTLEGDVSVEYTGHLGAGKKEENDAESAAKREENLKEMIKKRLSNADVTQIQIENVTDPDKPFTYRFHVRIPNYGQRTGKRLFFQPEFFQKGIDPLFTASQRKHNVYFKYPWSEVDEIEIRLPEGFALESLGGRQPLDIGDAGKYQLEIKVSEDRRVLRCLRNFAFGDNNNILIAASKYPLLKQLFDTIHELDNHTLTLAQETAP